VREVLESRGAPLLLGEKKKSQSRDTARKLRVGEKEQRTHLHWGGLYIIWAESGISKRGGDRGGRENKKKRSLLAPKSLGEEV